MELTDAIKLIKHATPQTPAVWADLGCGSGLFTYALANLLPAGSVIHAIDKTNTTLKKQLNPNNITILPRKLDFVADELDLARPDGILMANSLHFVKNKQSLLLKLGKGLKEGGSFLIVEYDSDSPNPWVPFPLSYHSLRKEFENAGYTEIKKLHERTSAFGRAMIYSAHIRR